MCDDRGAAVVLDARYEFTGFYLRSGRTLGWDEIRQTRYWQLVSAPLEARPRDGGRTWRYAEPDAQVRRFMALIDSLVDHGYVPLPRSRVLDGFDRRAPVHVEVDTDGARNTVEYTGRPFAGLITVIRYGPYYSALNGLHRLAALHYLRDAGAFRYGRVLTLRVG